MSEQIKTVTFGRGKRVCAYSEEIELVLWRNYDIQGEYGAWKYGGVGQDGNHRFVRVQGQTFKRLPDVKHFQSVDEAVRNVREIR